MDLELQFHKAELACLKTLKWDVQNQEQTQEIKLPENLPDMGRVLGAWGQSVLRGKNWQSEEVGVSCGAMVWVLYAPEDAGPARVVQAWLPVDMTWQIPTAKQDGSLCANCLLRSVDARMTSARRLMVRINMAVQVQVYVPDKVEISQPENVPEDVQLLIKRHLMTLPMETGEKSFMLDEELTLPNTMPKPASFLRFALQPDITDRKVMSGKVVFRGNANLHTLYEAQDGGLYSHDFQVPYSQYSDLEGDYSEHAQVRLCPQVTNLETETDEEGRIRLKAGLACQYVVYDEKTVELVEDAFSPVRKVEPQVQTLQLPSVEDMQGETVLLSHTIPAEAVRMADTAVLTDQVRKQSLQEETRLEIPATAQLLYYDADGILQGANAKWEDSIQVAVSNDTTLETDSMPIGMARGEIVHDGILTEAQAQVGMLRMSNQMLPMVCALELGQIAAKDPNRPSVILRRADKDGLWKIAKQTGSSMEAIMQANGLTEEPEEGKMLLIPIL